MIACIGDLLSLFILGRKFPGYSQVTDTISSLGASVSPVSNLTNAWWIIIGIIFLLFAAGFATAYKEKGRTVIIAALLIAVYGVGEGMGSGIFKADHVGGSLTTSAIIHDAIGGIGIVAILILPLVMRRIFNKEKHRAFYIFSNVIFYTGIFFSLLFLSRYGDDNFPGHYKGLWQRMTLVNTYLYFVVISVMMARAQLKLPDNKRL
jgi:hypothetical membrane protein